METMPEVVARLGLTIKATFVPFSQSRHAKDKSRTLNWKVSLFKGERKIITSDYSAGEAHAPAYKADAYPLLRRAMIEHELETGRTARLRGGHWIESGGPIVPDTVNVVACFARDADVISYSDFEDWAQSYGYDVDSRSAEKTYRECLAHALALRAALGNADFEALCLAAQDY